MASDESATLQEADTSEDHVIVDAIPVKFIESIESIELVSEDVWQDRLIEEVKNYPILWDRTRRDYGHQEKCAIIWALISKALGRAPAYCSGQWKNLRDSYVRRLKCVRRLAFHGLTPRKPSWRHFDSMTFLDDHVAHRGNVDSRTDQPLPSCSARNVAFFDGFARAPNKNKLGGIGKKSGPSHVCISTLPKEPVALFSRLGTGEIVVVDDSDRLNDADDAFGGKHDNTNLVTDAKVDSITSSGVVLPENYAVVRGEDGDEENIVFVIIEEKTDKSDSTQNADKSEEEQSALSTADSETIVSESEKTEPVSRKRSNGQTSDSSTSVEAKRKRDESASNSNFQEEIRSDLGNIRQTLNAFADTYDNETNLFAQYVATSLAHLPISIRAKTKLKIQQLLYEAEVLTDEERITCSKDGCVSQDTQANENSAPVTSGNASSSS